MIGHVFDDVPPDSSLQVVRLAAEAYRTNNVMRYCYWGGSVIDTSKATNILVSEGGNDFFNILALTTCQNH